MGLLRKPGSLNVGRPGGALAVPGMLNPEGTRGSVGGGVGSGTPGDPVPPAGSSFLLLLTMHNS